MTYRIINREEIIIDVVEYTLDDGSKVIVTVPIFTTNKTEEEQIIYRGGLI